MKALMISFSVVERSGFERQTLGCMVFKSDNFFASSVFFSKKPSLRGSPSRYYTDFGRFSANLE
jgi:hypothetical protein